MATESHSLPPLASAEALPRGLTRDSQRGADLGPTHFAGPKNLNHSLELIAPALQRVLDRLKSPQQMFRRQLLDGQMFRAVWKTTGEAFVAQHYALAADENPGRTGDQHLHLVMRLEAERAVHFLRLHGAGGRRSVSGGPLT